MGGRIGKKYRVYDKRSEEARGNMKVLVTGASGFLGSHIAEQLSAEGHSVVALVRKSSKVDFLSKLPGLELATGTVEDAASVRAAMQGVDAVIHSAGVVKARSEDEFFAGQRAAAPRTFSTRRRRSRPVSEALRLRLQPHRRRAGADDGRPSRHRRAARPSPATAAPRSPPKRSSREAKDQLPVVIIRPPMIYGPRDNESFAFFQSVSLPLLALPRQRQQHPERHLRLRRGERLHQAMHRPTCRAAALLRRRRRDLRRGPTCSPTSSAR
jgi:hypothetical protein